MTDYQIHQRGDTLALQAKSLEFCSANVTHPHGRRRSPDVHANTLAWMEAFYQATGLLTNTRHLASLRDE